MFTASEESSKISMREKIFALGSQRSKHCLKVVDESGFCLSMHIGYISFLFMFITISCFPLNPVFLRRQKSKIPLGAEVLELWIGL